jgi:hypothetical protein
MPEFMEGKKRQKWKGKSEACSKIVPGITFNNNVLTEHPFTTCQGGGHQ